MTHRAATLADPAVLLFAGGGVLLLVLLLLLLLGHSNCTAPRQVLIGNNHHRTPFWGEDLQVCCSAQGGE